MKNVYFSSSKIITMKTNEIGLNNNKRTIMSSITFSKDLYPKLTVGDYEYVGINILSKLKHLKEEKLEIRNTI